VLDDRVLDDLLQRLIQLAAQTLRGAASVSITLQDEGGYRTSNSTGRVALVIDEAQYEADAGPCLEALRRGEQVQVQLDEAVDRWPAFAARAREEGITGVLSTPLVLGADPGSVGAMNMYSAEGGTFDAAEQRTARMMAEHAAVLVGTTSALLSARQANAQLETALASREVIGMAKGILMEREGCDRDEAFDILRRGSQRENRKLRDLADALVDRVEARGKESGS
jgi:GAF domain-containing protein